MEFRKYWTMFLCLLMLLTALAVMPVNMGAEDPPEEPPGEPELPEEPDLEGEGEWWIDANGTYFELTNSSYLNITFSSSENIHLYLESIPSMINYHIERNCTSDSAEITMSGFEACTTYYRYQEGDLQEEFTTDETGTYSYFQDISTPHHVWIQEIEATIYIDQYGNIDPPTAPISRVGEVFTLTDNIYDSIYIQRSGITLDGAGYTVDGPGWGYGIYMSNINYATIKNFDINDFSYCIYMYNSDRNTVIDNTFSSSYSYGIRLYYSCSYNVINDNTFSGGSSGIVLYNSNYYNTISGNVLSSNDNYGIFLDYYCYYNTISGNSVSGSNYGVRLDRTRYNTLSNNVIFSNNYNFGVFGDSSSHFYQYIDTSNTVDGKPIYYLLTVNNIIIDSSTNAGYVGIVNSHHITVKDLTLTNNGQGVLLANTHDSTIQNVEVTDNYYGIYFYYSYRNTISDCTITNNYYGIYMDRYSNSNIISGNTITGSAYGIYGDNYNNYNTISENTISVDSYGIYMYRFSSNTLTGNSISGSYLAIRFQYCDSNTISSNTITGGSYGLYLDSYCNSNTLTGNSISVGNMGIRLNYYCNSNTINENTISDCSYGIYLYNADSNKLLKNSISGSNTGIYMYYSDDNIIKANDISYNTYYGIRIYYSETNTIYHNNIITNANQAFDSNPSNNDWHHPELLRGNYWSDYAGVDDGSGGREPGDGIGDTLIPHPGSNYDNYPFINPWQNTAPSISSFTSTTPVPENSPVTFTVIANDIDGDELTYSLDSDNDGTFDHTGTDGIITHCYADDFQGTARVRVSDDDYGVEATTLITITNANPTVNAGADLTMDEGSPFPGTLGFTDPGFDYSPWGTVEDFTASVDWGDSLVETVDVQETPGSPGVPTQGTLLGSHTYLDNGQYTLTAEVCDDNGGCGSDSITVTVENVPPSVEIVRMRPYLEGNEIFPASADTLAQFEFNGDVTDSSGNGRDAVLIGGEFVQTEFGQGLYIHPFGGQMPMGIDWSAYASLIRHPYTIEIVLAPWYPYFPQKLFSFEDDNDNGWYYENEGFRARPNPTIGEWELESYQRHYLAIVSTSQNTINVYFQGHYIGSTDAGFSGTLSQAIFFRDDSYTNRWEQLIGTVDALRISGVALDSSDFALVQQRLSSNPPVVAVGSPVDLKGTFTDPGILDTHTAEWIIGTDSIPGTVYEEDGSGEVIDQLTFNTAGIYNVILRVTDKDGGIGEANTIQGVSAMVVVYDPEDGFVTGGGWIYSPQDAYLWDHYLEGKATFGFVSKYQKGAHIPTGSTEFHFNVADLHFYSDSYDWLVIAGARAQYKGSGTLVIKDKWGGPWDQEYECGFMLTAVDGQIPGGGGKDKFRIKIWLGDYEGYVIYDNQRYDGDEAPLTTEIGGGSIQIKKG